MSPPSPIKIATFQGAKLMQKFQWLLNPRQVFDLTKGGPQPAIEMFKKVPKVKLLACGGDGTVREEGGRNLEIQFIRYM